MTIPHDAYETDEEIPAPRRSWLPRFSVYAGVWLLVLLFVVVLFYDRSLHSVRSGELGIRWSRFGGTRLGVVYREGLRIIPPWDQLFIYNVRQQEMSDSITVLAKNGLPLRIRYSARFMPAPGYLAKLHQQFGPDYREVLLRPEVVAGIRRVMGNHTPEEIYSQDEEWLNEEVMASIRQEIAQYPVKLGSGGRNQRQTRLGAACAELRVPATQRRRRSPAQGHRSAGRSQLRRTLGDFHSALAWSASDGGVGHLAQCQGHRDWQRARQSSASPQRRQLGAPHVVAVHAGRPVALSPAGPARCPGCAPYANGILGVLLGLHNPDTIGHRFLRPDDAVRAGQAYASYDEAGVLLLRRTRRGALDTVTWPPATMRGIGGE
jgi:hypothetical protein